MQTLSINYYAAVIFTRALHTCSRNCFWIILCVLHKTNLNNSHFLCHLVLSVGKQLALLCSHKNREAPIIGRLSAVLPIIGIGRLLRRYRTIIVYTLVVFDGVKTSWMLSCQAVTIDRDVRGVASLAWGGVSGMGGDWSVIDHAAQPLPTPPLSPPRTCPSSM